MKVRLLRSVLLVAVAMLMSYLLIAQQADTTGTSRPRQEVVQPNKGVVFPDVTTRLMIAGAGVFVLGGMALFLNAKRKQLDKEAGIQ